MGEKAVLILALGGLHCGMRESRGRGARPRWRHFQDLPSLALFFLASCGMDKPEQEGAHSPSFYPTVTLRGRRYLPFVHSFFRPSL